MSTPKIGTNHIADAHSSGTGEITDAVDSTERKCLSEKESSKCSYTADADPAPDRPTGPK